MGRWVGVRPRKMSAKVCGCAERRGFLPPWVSLPPGTLGFTLSSFLHYYLGLSPAHFLGSSPSGQSRFRPEREVSSFSYLANSVSRLGSKLLSLHDKPEPSGCIPGILLFTETRRHNIMRSARRSLCFRVLRVPRRVLRTRADSRALVVVPSPGAPVITLRAPPPRDLLVLAGLLAATCEVCRSAPPSPASLACRACVVHRIPGFPLMPAGVARLID